MIERKGVIYAHAPQRKKEKEDDRKKFKGFDGDSGVGQAPEFPSKSLSPRQKPTRSLTAGILSTLGSLLIFISIIGVLFTYGPIIRAEVGYRLSNWLDSQRVNRQGNFRQIIDKTLTGEVEGVPDPNFSLVIPKIHAKSKIIANVDPGDERAYMAALKEGVAHAQGTFFPGGLGNIYLFAHSTDSPFNIIRYNAVFYLLRELEPGDEVLVYFSGTKHRYQVTDKKIVEPADISYLTPFNPENKEQLILQTCWPPGTTLKRLIVFAEKTK
ncbi:class E sortase [Candidatus Gottesmanbacteria bacterium]|nr:class E sortase [Candidatus Gottesmanbacteria bacterium]